MIEEGLVVRNGETFHGETGEIEIDRFRQQVLSAVAEGGRLASLLARPRARDGFQLLAIIAHDAEAGLEILAASVAEEYPALAPDCPQAHWFEREIYEQWGVKPLGHPWLKPIRFQPPRAGARTANRSRPVVCGDADFYRMEGEEIHEVAVGPVHAGIIEPGHFRFQCHGETVFHLEISLGYQHRGIERALAGGPNARTPHYIETAAGDTTIGHMTAYCRALEALSQTRVPARAQVLRGIALELERVANHVGDLGALAGDVGYLPTASYCGRIRGDVLNLTAMLCGNRFGRRLARPGGTAIDLSAEMAGELKRRVKQAAVDARVAIELLWDSPSVMARFDGAGPISVELCREIGLVGVAARACGLARDVRQDFPYGIYRFAQIPVSTWHSGDVFARAYVRWLEVQRSLAFVLEQIDSLPAGPVLERPGPLRPDTAVATLVEGWRGEICHYAATDSRGQLELYKLVDPSLHNWFGLAMALRNQAISDFPLCNKSFNLSYCGHDL